MGVDRTSKTHTYVQIYFILLYSDTCLLCIFSCIIHERSLSGTHVVLENKDYLQGFLKGQML